MTEEQYFEEYLNNMTVAERRTYKRSKTFDTIDFEKFKKWYKYEKDLKQGNRKYRFIAKTID